MKRYSKFTKSKFNLLEKNDQREPLRILDLRCNQLLEVSETICMLKQLVVLELAGNQLRNLPDLRSLNRLTHLNLSANRFQILPNSIRLLKRLEVLNLHGNLLQTFPDDILGCLKHLSHLTLCKNQLKNLPDCLARWPRTFTIFLEDNQLTQDEIKKWESCLEQVHRDHPKLGPKIYFSEF